METRTSVGAGKRERQQKRGGRVQPVHCWSRWEGRVVIQDLLKGQQGDSLLLLGHREEVRVISRCLLPLPSTRVAAQGRGLQETAVRGQLRLNGSFATDTQPPNSPCSPLTRGLYLQWGCQENLGWERQRLGDTCVTSLSREPCYPVPSSLVSPKPPQTAVKI